MVFDIGGTWMRVATATDDALGTIACIRTPQNPDEGFAALTTLIQEAGGKDITRVAGSIPGVLEKDGMLFRIPNIPAWQGHNVAQHLKRTVCEEVTLLNDAALAALGEATYGAGQGVSIVAYIGVGTGLGGARVVNGSIDARAYGFEPGWHYLDAPGGLRFEEMISGNALRRKHNNGSEHLTHDIFESLTPTLAKGLYNAIMFWSPEVLVLGGSLINEDNGFHMDEIQEELEKLDSVFPRLPLLAKAKLGERAGLEGARAILCGAGNAH